MCTPIAHQATNGSYNKPLQENKAKSSDSSLLENVLLDILTNSPEMKDIENIVDQHFYTIHGDKDSIEKLERLFSKFIQANSSNLSNRSKTSLEKADEIFDAYREAYLITAQKDSTFQDAIEKQQRALAVWGTWFPASKIESAIQSMVLARIKTFHSTVPGLALEKVLSLAPYSLRFPFPDHFSSAQTDILNLLTFYQRHLAKFSPYE